jgi:hypothetical protein
MSVISRHLKYIYLACDHNNVRHGKDIEFENGKYQQSGTIIQEEHRSKYKQYNNTSKITSLSSDDISIKSTAYGSATGFGKYGRLDGQRNRATSLRPLTLDDACTFAFTVFCSGIATAYGKWYVSRRKFNNANITESQYHTNHLPIQTIHLNRPRLQAITPAVIAKIQNLLRSGTPVESIALLVKQMENVIISHSQIRKIKDNMISEEILEL